MKKIIIVVILLISIICSSQEIKKDSLDYKLNDINTTLKAYGKQNVITDKITLGSIAIVIIGSAFNMKPTPMLVTSSLCSLAILTISYKADLKLSKHKDK